MNDLEAMRAALYVFHLPSAVRTARERALPQGIPMLLAVAAGEEEATDAAALRLERQAGVVQQAAAFFIEQILLAPGGDAYRVLGAERDATDAELRRNMAMLLRWAHPDMDRAGERMIYAGRVTGAWERLKTPERRAAYDEANPVRQASAARTTRAQLPRPRPLALRGPPPAADAPPAGSKVSGLAGFVRRLMGRGGDTR